MASEAFETSKYNGEMVEKRKPLFLGEKLYTFALKTVSGEKVIRVERKMMKSLVSLFVCLWFSSWLTTAEASLMR